MPNVHHLELFGLVVKHGGIAAAAKNSYGIGLPAISMQIKELERELEGRLFTRRPFCLTPLGRRWYEPIKQFFGLIEGLTARSAQEPGFTFRLGASEHVPKEYLMDVLAVISRHAGEIHFNLEPLRPEALQPGVLRGLVDIAIGPLYGEIADDIEVLHVLSLEPVLIVPSTKPFAHIRSADYSWRQGKVKERLVRPFLTESLAQVFTQKLRVKNVTWEPLIESGSVALVTTVVAAGSGVGLTLNLPTLVNDPRLRVIRLPGFPLIEYGLMWNLATREYCAPLRTAMKSTAETLFKIAPSGKLLKAKA